MKSLKFAAIAASVTLFSFSGAPSFAAGSHDEGHSDGGHSDGGHGGGANIGTPGTAASRTINVTMYDNYYEPESISIAHGETIKFVIKNEGEFLHEFNINTPSEHAAHAPMMEMMFDMGMLEVDRVNHEKMAATKGSGHDMSHDEPNSALVEPGKSAEIIWKFDTDANLEFACNIPGHYDSGMAGPVQIAH